MRTPALILLIPCLVFLTETATFTGAMQESCAAAGSSGSCTKAKNSSPCSRKKENTACSRSVKKTRCSSEKNSDKGTAGNKCKNDATCTSCPVCYTFLFEPQYEWKAQELPVRNNYRSGHTGSLSSYATNVWKPPNDFYLLFSE